MVVPEAIDADWAAEALELKSAGIG